MQRCHRIIPMTPLFALPTTIALFSPMAAACANQAKVKAKKQLLV